MTYDMVTLIVDSYSEYSTKKENYISKLKKQFFHSNTVILLYFVGKITSLRISGLRAKDISFPIFQDNGLHNADSEIKKMINSVKLCINPFNTRRVSNAILIDVKNYLSIYYTLFSKKEGVTFYYDKLNSSFCRIKTSAVLQRKYLKLYQNIKEQYLIINNYKDSYFEKFNIVLTKTKDLIIKIKNKIMEILYEL